MVNRTEPLARPRVPLERDPQRVAGGRRLEHDVVLRGQRDPQRRGPTSLEDEVEEDAVGILLAHGRRDRPLREPARLLRDDPLGVSDEPVLYGALARPYVETADEAVPVAAPDGEIAVKVVRRPGGVRTAKAEIDQVAGEGHASRAGRRRAAEARALAAWRDGEREREQGG